MSASKLKPAVSRARTSRFERRGLRGYFEYRDVGVKRASGGKILAHVIRSRPGKAPHGDWHYHDCQAQFVYVLKGWVKMHYEGGKPMVLKKGDCFYQPPRIRHRELAHSSDLEMLEIVAPGNFRTFSIKVV